MSQAETAAMLRNVVAKAKESGKTHAEVMTWIVAQTLLCFKDMPESKAKQATQVQAAPAAIENHKGDPNPTGPVVKWVPPQGGWYRHDGRFVKDETWKPVEKPVEQERAPSVPDVLAQMQQGTPVKSDKRMIAVTLPNGSQKFYEDTPEFRAQREKEAKAQAGQQTIVAVPKTVDEPKRVPPAPAVLNTHTDHMASFTQAWDGPAERND